MGDGWFTGVAPTAAWAAWCGSAWLVSATLTFLMIRAASRLGVIDRPNARSSHQRPTPRGGGLAIVATVLAGAAALVILGVPAPRGGGWALLGGVLVAAVSGLDDLSSIPNRMRFGTHLLAATIAMVAIGPVRSVDLGSLGTVDFGVAAWPLTALWIVGMTNAFNFMDGIDGIAGITAAAALAVLATGYTVAGQAWGGLFAAAAAAASAGFLVWNWQPARIFMGDVGSAFLGYTIAVLPLAAAESARNRLVPLTAVVMAPFLIDTILTLARRLSKGENIFEAHRSHLYQRLVIAGWSHRAVSSLYGLLAATCGGIAVAWLLSPSLQAAAGWAAVAMLVFVPLLLVTLVRITEAKAGQLPMSAGRA